MIAGTGTYFTNSLSPIITVNGDVEAGSNLRIYHLVRPIDEHHYQNNKTSERTHKAIPEIFLTRLLSTKGTIQKFVDDFFNTILTANEALPPAVKWLFDLLDDAARKHSITESEVVHAWKSNRWAFYTLEQLPMWKYVCNWQEHCKPWCHRLSMLAVGSTHVAMSLSLIIYLASIGCNSITICYSVIHLMGSSNFHVKMQIEQRGLNDFDIEIVFSLEFSLQTLLKAYECIVAVRIYL